ncbi:hypothetical protein [Nocardioides zeae]|uniref:Uncharacterized protein n=1 Tax=Nocardioides zeae TaxID=1457234 RepID=A0A6P0HMK2_9ACTN|nr:hypothetical protein [Nocardioides zeae]NEN79853.1 hypothetical protein [Nocardioides zeae]
MLKLVAHLAAVVATVLLSFATVMALAAVCAALFGGMFGGWELSITLGIALVAWWRFLSRRADRLLARWDRFRAFERAEQQREGVRA